MRMFALTCCFCGLVVSVIGGNARAAQAQSKPTNGAEFEKVVAPFLAEHCLGCHNEQNAQSEFRLDNLASDLQRSRSAWREVIDRIRSGEMPPDGFDDHAMFVDSVRVADWLAKNLGQLDGLRAARREPVSFYRLSRQEYANTVNDLLGMDFHVDDAGLNPDDRWHGFHRIGSALTVSASHIEKYLDAASMILDEAFPDQDCVPVQFSMDALALSGVAQTTENDQLKTQGNADVSPRPRLDLWPGQNAQIDPSSIWGGGRYRFRIQASGLVSNERRPPHLAVYAQNLDRLLFEQDLVVAEDQPLEISFNVHLPPGTHQFLVTNEVVGHPMLKRLGRTSNPFYSIKRGYLPWQLPLISSQGTPNYPCLIVDRIAIDGPFVTADVKTQRKRFWPANESDQSGVRDCLSRFAEQAFRRPLKNSEIDRYTRFVSAEIERGGNLRTAIKTGMLAILSSKDFLYLVEGQPDNNSDRLTDWELATRLSYFLWSSMPDDTLFELARRETLHQPEVLRQQVARMLADPRSSRFAEDFPSQWLQLDRVGMFKPNTRLYPDYDLYLQRSMILETTQFFDQVLRRGLTLREFISSQWTMLNPRLAIHYEIDLGEGHETNFFRRVSLRPNHRRGGVLTHASILSLTSDGTRHRPVHRGVWLTESIIGQSVPSPPANVEPIDPNPVDQQKSTVRMKLSAHIANPNCLVCHQKIDPYGFAFENYDAIGQWRTREIVPTGTGVNPIVDSSGTLPDGRFFRDTVGLQKLLLEDIRKFNKAFVTKLTTYALRRPMTPADDAMIFAISQKSAENDYRLRSIVEAIVLSDPFQQR